MHVEQPAVEIRHSAQQRFELRCTLALAESFVKEFQQEIAVEGMELSLSPFLLYAFEPAGEVVGITIELTWCLCIQETLALDKIDEHQAVEHERGIPRPISLRVNPPHQIPERTLLQFEAV